MTDINIAINDLILLKSEYLLIDSDSLKINIDELILNIKFLDDEDPNRKPYLNAKASNDQTELNMKLFNYKKSNGSGFIKPLEIGELDEKNLYFSYWVQTINYEENKRILAFNLYKEA